ncbi:potassium-transporting ATPase subunit KdpC [Polyangium aurulentum]|uniref:potassium-transporting ATPase subunit KdpC n=1 Tax=Polyangium aurulentum TaxID=2567896 RepID=UPI0010AE1D31|nr:potassium-transporting ATPase subunit KdpC [Polyangium aurulentum]UQA55587.1 potassium-transporting ATPase subunit KdpC [Polyangium aurulentum]
MRSLVRPALVLVALFTLLCGIAYPLALTGVAEVVFPAQARGSLLSGDQGEVLGSRLIGQPFSAPGYFWGRPSATAPFAYNAAASTGSNLGPTSEALAETVRARIAALRAADPENTAPVPVDLVTASGSGLDPHISPAAAQYQIGRVARARGLPEDQVRRLVDAHTEEPSLGIFGERRVDVLGLNLALDRATKSAG